METQQGGGVGFGRGFRMQIHTGKLGLVARSPEQPRPVSLPSPSTCPALGSPGFSRNITVTHIGLFCVLWTEAMEKPYAPNSDAV